MRRILVAISYDSDFVGLRSIVFGTVIGGVLLYIQTTVLLSCVTLMVQSLLLPLLACLVFLPRFNLSTPSERLIYGAELGGLISAFGISTYVLTSLLKYYFYGGRELAAAALGAPAMPLTFMDVFLSLFLYLVLWTFFVVIGILAGVGGAKILESKKVSTPP